MRYKERGREYMRPDPEVRNAEPTRDEINTAEISALQNIPDSLFEKLRGNKNLRTFFNALIVTTGIAMTSPSEASSFIPPRTEISGEFQANKYRGDKLSQQEKITSLKKELSREDAAINEIKEQFKLATGGEQLSYTRLEQMIEDIKDRLETADGIQATILLDEKNRLENQQNILKHRSQETKQRSIRDIRNQKERALERHQQNKKEIKDLLNAVEAL